MRLLKAGLSFLLMIGILGGCAGINDEQPADLSTAAPANEAADLDREGWYSSKEEVAEYLEIYGQLPSNYITKKEAEALGWNAQEGNLWEVAEGMSIGGDRFGNREGLLPDEKGRTWTECDIDYDGGFRNGKRLVFSNDGLIYYTDDHYASFEELKGENDAGDN